MTESLVLKRVKFMGGDPFVTWHVTLAKFPSTSLKTSNEISGFDMFSELEVGERW